jgi:hypothetical protein
MAPIYCPRIRRVSGVRPNHYCILYGPRTHRASELRLKYYCVYGIAICELFFITNLITFFWADNSNTKWQVIQPNSVSPKSPQNLKNVIMMSQTVLFHEKTTYSTICNWFVSVQFFWWSLEDFIHQKMKDFFFGGHLGSHDLEIRSKGHVTID